DGRKGPNAQRGAEEPTTQPSADQGPSRYQTIVWRGARRAGEERSQFEAQLRSRTTAARLSKRDLRARHRRRREDRMDEHGGHARPFIALALWVGELPLTFGHADAVVRPFVADAQENRRTGIWSARRRARQKPVQRRFHRFRPRTGAIAALDASW